MNFKDEDFSELNLKKEIFDLCGMTNYAFRENPKLLFTSSETYYARLMFFRELGIKITEKNFMKTLGLTNIQFAKEYGRMIVVKGNKKDEQYDKEVKRNLIKRYPMPKTLREIKRSVGDRNMIYIKEDRKNGKKIHVFNKENEFTFENARVLPAEQRDLLLELLTKLARKNAGQLDEEFEMSERERIAGEMLKRFQDARLTQKARIRTLYSTGGSLTSGTESEKDSMKTKGVKVEYLAIDINGVVILEPFGQLNNATLITPHTDDVEYKLTEFGRKGVLDKGFFKVMHDGKPMPGYNYESDHILKILDMTIEDKDRLLKVLKDVREKENVQYCGLRRVRRNYYPMKAVSESKITKQEVLDIAKTIEDKEYKVYIYNHIREEEYTLYGFRTEQERDMFLRLINVKGVGPKLALPILASPVDAIYDAIERENILYLKKFPKIGDKVAKQIILDLKGKLNIQVTGEVVNNSLDELVEVLEGLGYKSKEIKGIVAKVDASLSIEDQVKEALKLLLK